MSESLPSVLIVLVVRNGAPWLRECLAGISAQRYERLGVVAVDCGSTDGSGEILLQSLGDQRVMRAPGAGVGAALAKVASLDAAQAVDYFLLVHDDAALEPDAVARLVEAAEALERPGAVGAKLVDWDNPRALREVGWSSDRFGHPYSPLEKGEIDQGQYDRLREVLFVSDAVVLVSQPATVKVGVPDERLGSHDEELDYCWRLRLAGFSVAMSPLAVARHVDAAKAGERAGDRSADHRRYYEERAAIVAFSKNYGWGSAWTLPVYVVQGILKFLALILARRFEEAGDLMAAWGWNLVHLPGTLRRRFRAQKVRVVKDREIHRYMAGGNVKLRRWLEAAGRVLPDEVQVPDDDAQEAFVPLHERASSAARAHPVAAAWVLVAIIAAMSYRHFLSAGQLTGGGLPAILPDAGAFFTELVSGVRTTVLGGTQAASPALAAIGAAASVPLSSVELVEKLLLMALPILAGVAAYRMSLRLCGRRVPSLVGAGIYVATPLFLWSFSTGRVGLLVLLAILPRVAERITVAAGPVAPARRWRFLVGTGVFVAVGIAFLPGSILAVGMLVAAGILLPERSGRRLGGLGLSLGFVFLGMVLAFPLVIDVARDAGVGLGSLLGVPDVADLARFVLVPGKGDWGFSWILPVAALLGFSLAGSGRRSTAWRLLLLGSAGWLLSWASAAGWLPGPIANAPVYLSVAALSASALVAIGLVSVQPIRSHPSGVRFLGRLLAACAVVVLTAQGALAAWGAWDVGRHRLPPAWPLVGSQPGAFRVLWIGSSPGMPFPAPGGDPARLFEAGTDTIRYTVTDEDGSSALDIGRDQHGPGYDAIDAALGELVSGRGRHMGSLLAPSGIRFIVAADGQVPAGLAAALGRQVDVTLVPAGGLTIYENEVGIPPVAYLSDPAHATIEGAPEIWRVAALGRPSTRGGSLTRVTGGFDGTAEEPGLAWVGQQWAPGWVLADEGGSVAGQETLDWATSYPVPQPKGDFSIRYRNQWVRTLEMSVLAAFWLLAFWMTRKPARR